MSADSQPIAGVAAGAATTPEPHSLISDQAAAALNDHGFLLQQAIRARIKGFVENQLNVGVSWKLEGYEYPVQAPDGSETTIDLLLKGKDTYLCVECKRPNASYKHWLFFDSTPFQQSVACHTWVEAAMICRDGRSTHRRIERMAGINTPTFQHFLEVTLSRPTKDGTSRNKPETPGTEKASRSDTLHASFRQAVTAISGLL